MSTEADRKKIFISHASEDAAIAEAFRDCLANYFSNTDPFCSSVDIHGGDDWLDRLREHLRSCTLMIVLCTPSSIKKSWILFESGAAWINERVQVHPILFTRHNEKLLPAPLTHIQYSELTSPEKTREYLNTIAGQFSLKPIGGKDLSAAAEALQTVITQEQKRLQRFDLFISMPLNSFANSKRYEFWSSHQDRLNRVKEDLTPVLEAISACEGMKNYYFAGGRVASVAPRQEGAPGEHAETFFSQDTASARDNYEALRNSARFMMIMPGEYWSGSLVESGYALAKSIPSVLFVKRGVKLPFMLRSASDIKELPVFENPYDQLSEIADLIKQRGTSVFPSK